MHEAVARADGEGHGLVGASAGEIHKSPELLAHGARELFASGANDHATAAALEQFDAEEFFQFSDLTTVLALPHGIATDGARDASGIGHRNEGAEPVE